MLGLVGKEGSEPKWSETIQGWNIVNKDLFLSALIVGSFTRAPRDRAPLCLVTILYSTYIVKIYLFLYIKILHKKMLFQHHKCLISQLSFSYWIVLNKKARLSNMELTLKVIFHLISFISQVMQNMLQTLYIISQCDL